MQEEGFVKRISALVDTYWSAPESFGVYGCPWSLDILPATPSLPCPASI